MTNISESRLGEIAERYGWVASFAIWKPEGERPNSGMNDTSVIHQNLEKLHTQIVFIGLNISRPITGEPFQNWHGGTHDYKLRRSTVGTVAEGAYMTDFLKKLPEPKSSEAMRRVKREPELLERNACSLREELRFVGASENTTLIAMGADTETLLRRSDFPNEFNVLRMRHYSDYSKRPDVHVSEFHELIAKIPSSH